MQRATQSSAAGFKGLLARDPCLTGLSQQLHVSKWRLLVRLCSVTGTQLANTSLPSFTPRALPSPPAPHLPLSLGSLGGTCVLKAKMVAGEPRARPERKGEFPLTSDGGTPTGARDPKGREGTGEDRRRPAGTCFQGKQCNLEKSCEGKDRGEEEESGSFSGVPAEPALRGRFLPYTIRT